MRTRKKKKLTNMAIAGIYGNKICVKKIINLNRHTPTQFQTCQYFRFLNYYLFCWPFANGNEIFKKKISHGVYNKIYEVDPVRADCGSHIIVYKMYSSKTPSVYPSVLPIFVWNNIIIIALLYPWFLTPRTWFRAIYGVA